MARFFDDASSQYLERASAVLSAYPISLSFWLYADAIGATIVPFGIAKSTSTNTWICAFLSAAGVLNAQSRIGATTGTALATAGCSVDTWYHGAAVFASNTSRAAYLDGGNKGTNSTDVTPTGLDVTAIARLSSSSPGFYWSGSIADVALWDVALTDDEVASLGLGVSPLLVQPASLVAYWPLIRDGDRDRVGGYDMTPSGSPTVAVHPSKIKPYWILPQTYGFPGTGVADLTINVSDGVTVGESVGPDPLQIAASTSDAVNVGEAIGRLLECFALVSDTVGTAESVTARLLALVSVSDAVGVAESVQAAMVDLAALTSEAVNLAESVQAVMSDLAASASDAVGLAEAVQAVVLIGAVTSDAVGLAESVQAAMSDLAASASDAVGVAESVEASVVAAGDLAASVSDAVGVAEQVQAALGALLASVSDTVNVAEQVAAAVSGATLQVAITPSNWAYWVQGVKVVG